MANQKLVVIFLRGGADGLSLISPTGDKNYVAARPNQLRVGRNGDGAGLKIKNANADVDFRFHHKARELHELFGAGELAVIHAAGLRDATRSHFDAEDRMERASPGQGSRAGGWLGRWIKTAKPEGILPVLAVGAAAPDSLRGGDGIAVAPDLGGLRLAPGHGYSTAIRAHLAKSLGGDALLGSSVNKLLSLSEAIEARVALDENGQLRPYKPASKYPEGNPLAQSLMQVAQTIKLDLGLRVSTVDFGGWDTHADQKEQFEELTGFLSSALMAFWRDLGKHAETTSVVIMSEFGRRLKSNESGGTDHGHGNVMMVLGPNVRGGKIYGDWPGLENDALDEGADLAITTDYRTVLSELMQGHMGFADTAALFPDFKEKHLGYLV